MRVQFTSIDSFHIIENVSVIGYVHMNDTTRSVFYFITAPFITIIIIINLYDVVKIFIFILAVVLNHNNRYYLLAYEPGSKEKSFRIDRMYDTKVDDRFMNEIPLDIEECIRKYRSSVYKMYSGNRVEVLFEFDFVGMNMIYDKYGQDITVKKVDEDKYRSRLDVEVSPPFWGWLVQLENHITIIDPYDVIEKFKSKIQSILNKYIETV